MGKIKWYKISTAREHTVMIDSSPILFQPLRKKTIARATTLSNFESDKVRKRRKRIAQEILETERTYVRNLQLILRVDKFASVNN